MKGTEGSAMTRSKQAVGPMRAAIYTRVSTAEQGEEDKVSLPLQEKRCRALCAARGWTVEKVYQQTTSGRKWARLDEVLEDARAGRFDILVFLKIDRFARKLRDLLNAEGELAEVGVAIASVADNFDTATLQGRAMFQVMGSFAELEVGTIAERLHGGIVERVKQGRLYKTGSAPYGYAYSKDTHQLTIDESTARTVRRIFSMYARDSMGIYRIATALTEEGIPSPGTVSTKTYSNKLGGSWQPSAVRSILRSPTYKGEALYGKDDVPMPCPAIIDASAWAKVQHLMKTRSASRGSAKRTYIAQGLMWCAICGWKMTAYTSDHRIAKYRCNRRAANGRVEAVRQIHEGYAWDLHAAPLEERIKEQVRAVMADPATLAAHVEARVDAIADAYDERLGAADSIARSLADIAAQESRVLDLAQKGLADDDQVRDRLAALAQDKKRLQREAKHAERSVEDIRDIEAQIESFTATLADLLTDEDLGVVRDDVLGPARWREPRTDDEWARVIRGLYDRIEVRSPIGSGTEMTYSGTVLPLTQVGSH